ncbi:AraC family transcriptional regulator [Paenibacillus xylanilyticus]|uniref:Helix-turn-helix transcriptional regulator n=1 Tax=Paenibacillus xylanilyticus TaxID=248903 RepID=A0A7Y6EWQ2_9BACL|nr:AraC family transcriptional regulator [Paenibacillus xylanilyticus]NUU79552.1 helix-turn-helix transcriptional regulator [Paenibacillus xylanilyticus]
MNPSIHLFKSEFFFNSDLQLFVNRCTEDFNVPFHAHDFIEYSYVAEGTGFHHIDQDIVPVQKGMLFVIPVGIPHVFRPASSNVSEHPLIIYNCLFNMELIHKLAATIQEEDIRSHLIDLAKNKVPYVSISDQHQQVEELMVKLYRETSVTGIGSSTMLYTLVSQLVVTTYRQLHQKMHGEQRLPADFEHILHYLDQHLSKRIRMSDLSYRSGWSEKQIGRMFLSYTGQTFSSYLQHLRIQKSRELLRNSQHKVTLIAELVGYRDVDTFYAVFKRITGETPLVYRKKSRV